jgi:hypothetical protein
MYCKRIGISILGLAVVAVALFGAPAAQAAIGAGSLIVSGANSTPTHWDIPIGVPTIAQICGVTTAEAGNPLPATIDVWVKSSQFGNTQLVATRLGTSDCYEFSYTPPAVANGDDFDACATTIVAYIEVGNNANNDVTKDGIDDDTPNAASGFRFVDGNGDPLDCHEVGVDSTHWSNVKKFYR